MNTSTATAESDAYLAAVRGQLDDLPEEERADLLEDLAQHLADVSANRGPDDPPLATLLGAPEQYAAELRSAADLPPRSSKPATKESFTARLGRSLPVRLTQTVWRHKYAVPVREFIPQLRPTAAVAKLPIPRLPMGWRWSSPTRRATSWGPSIPDGSVRPSHTGPRFLCRPPRPRNNRNKKQEAPFSGGLFSKTLILVG